MKQYKRLLVVAVAVAATHLCPYQSKAGIPANYKHRFVADRPMTGKVTSGDGAPLVNVNVVVNGTTTGTASRAAPPNTSPFKKQLASFIMKMSFSAI